MRYLAVALLGLFGLESLGICAEGWREDLEPFISTHCFDCHSGGDAAAGLDLTSLDANLEHPEARRLWTLAHDRIESGEMPPPDAEPVADSEISSSLATLSRALVDSERAVREVVLRRLNRNEYENTVNDLFGTRVRVGHLLPQDGAADGFDNVGAGLDVSPEAMQAYLEAADVVLDAVFGPTTAPPKIIHRTNLLEQTDHLGNVIDSQWGKMFRKTDEGLVIFQSGYCPTNLVNFARLRAPAGTYRCTFRVRAVQTEKPVTLRIYGGDTIVGRREKHVAGYFDVMPGEWMTIEFEDELLEPGGTFQPKCYGTQDTRKDADTYPEPGIEIGEITIEGPLEPWPPESRLRLLGDVDVAKGTLEDAEKILRQLLASAFRRPVSDIDVQRLVSVVDKALLDKRSFEDSLRLGLKVLLCSPEFLYMEEQSGADGRLDNHALAARLSYFFWSSMPDDELRRLADTGSLHKEDELRRQVARMLRDKRAQRFVMNFTGQWLSLRDIDFTSPDANLYPDYDELLRLSMLEETRLFFCEVLEKNLSVLNFIDSDFTFLNQRLAEHYGIEGIEGQEFRKVPLPEASVRGGVMTQASVLKVTANGTTTSPVIRGAWVMERLAGKTIPPPPSGIPAVEPDIRGAVTLREQLEKHRNEDTCAACHSKFDPAGFALENFDVIGGWRDNYRSLGDQWKRPALRRDPHTFDWIRYRIGPRVDASGETWDGKAFEDVREFKRLLLQDRESIVKGLTKKLATYATGRSMMFSDREELDRITASVAQQGFGLQTLIQEIVVSPIFLQP